MKLKRFALLLVTLLWAGGCASDRQIIDQANNMHGGLKPAVITDARLANYLQRMGQRIIDVAQEMDRAHYGPDAHRSEDPKWMFQSRMQFHFVNSQTLNAFTTGGEHMYIYTKLFQTCKTEDELAAVVAHEYAHVYGRHVHKGMNRQYAMFGGAAALGAAGYALGGKDHGKEYGLAFLGAGLVAGKFIGMGFTRGDEGEADEMGFDFYTRAGWDPRRFGDFFQRMVDMGYDKGPEFLSDHPSLKSRKATADQRAAELPPQARSWRRPNVAPPEEFAALQKYSIDLGKRMPSDKSLEGAQKILAALPRSCLTPAVHEDQKQARQQLVNDVEREKQLQKKKKKD